MVYNIIMYKDHDNFIVDNIFTDQEINDIYKNIETLETQTVGVLGQTAYHGEFPDHIISKIEKTMNAVLTYPVKLTEYSFARYSNKSGYSPKLFPHYDSVFDAPRITLDVQLKSNFNWDLFVEGKQFSLKDNQALVFSGNTQIHWRENQKILDGETLDMVFCHFSSTKYPILENNHKATMESRELMWGNKIKISKKEERV